MRVRFFRIFLVPFFALLVFPSISHGETSVVEVGVITPLTGPLATIGTAVRNGIELAQKESPDLFRRVSFRFEDDQADGKQSLRAYRALTLGKRPKVLLGFGTILAQTIGPLVERDQVPLLNFNFDAAPAVGKQFVIRTLNHTDEYMAPVAEHLVRAGNRELLIVQSESTFFDAMISSLGKALNGRATVKVVATLPPGEMDFRATIARLRVVEGSAVGIFLWPDQILAFLRQAREAKIRASYFGTDLCETAASLGGVEDLVEGCLYGDNNATADFRSRYQQAFGNEAQLTFAGSAYDMATLVGHYLKEGGDSALDFRDYAAQARDREGVVGSYSFKNSAETGSYFAYPVVVKRIEGKRGVAVR